jgi:hypothetical protein
VKDITHIERSPLPWRPERATECGLDASRHPTWTREQAKEKEKALGRQRFSLFVCMTCFCTMDRHSTWQEDPASCLVRHASPMATTRWGRGLEPDFEKRRFADELRAISALVAEHREEFDALVGNLSEVVDIREAQRRAKILGKGRMSDA